MVFIVEVKAVEGELNINSYIERIPPPQSHAESQILGQGSNIDFQGNTTLDWPHWGKGNVNIGVLCLFK